MKLHTRRPSTSSSAGRVLPIGVFATAVLLMTLPVPATNVAAEKVATEGPTLESVTLLSRHRAFEYFAEAHTVKLDEVFQIGDSEFEGRIFRYEPDFAMEMKTHRIFSRTAEPKNPAFQVAVFRSGEPQDTSWAFLNMPPHFGKKSLIAFQVMQINFEDREPLVNSDTTRAELPPLDAAPQGGPHGGEAPR